MDIFIMHSPPMPTPKEAILAASNLSVSSFKGATKKIHIHVIHVTQIGEMWVAVLQVTIEPELEEKEEETLKSKPLELKNKEDKEFYAKLDPEMPEQQNLKPTYGIENEVHFYMHPQEAGLDYWNVVLPQELPTYNFHFLEDDSFWRTSKEIFPDIDFDRAAQLISQPTPTEGDTGGDGMEKKPKLKKNPYILELTEEA